MVYIVTAVKDVCRFDRGVEIVGIFDTSKKAFKAKEMVAKWLENKGYKDCAVFVSRKRINNIAWYEIDEIIYEIDDLNWR